MDMDHPHRAAQVSGETADPSPRGRLDSVDRYQLVDHLLIKQMGGSWSDLVPFGRVWNQLAGSGQLAVNTG